MIIVLRSHFNGAATKVEMNLWALDRLVKGQDMVIIQYLRLMHRMNLVYVKGLRGSTALI